MKQAASGTTSQSDCRRAASTSPQQGCSHPWPAATETPDKIPDEVQTGPNSLLVHPWEKSRDGRAKSNPENLLMPITLVVIAIIIPVAKHKIHWDHLVALSPSLRKTAQNSWADRRNNTVTGLMTKASVSAMFPTLETFVEAMRSMSMMSGKNDEGLAR